jgi:hypothetical protein
VYRRLKNEWLALIGFPMQPGSVKHGERWIGWDFGYQDDGELRRTDKLTGPVYRSANQVCAGDTKDFRQSL